MAQQQRQHEAEQGRLVEQRMLEAVRCEEQEDRMVVSEAFWDNLQLMRESLTAIRALGTPVTTPMG